MNNKSVFIVAELSANHNQSMQIAIDTIRAAKKAGADAIKLQTYTPDTLTINSDKDDFIINNGSIWDGQNYYELYKTAYTPWEWHKKLYEVAKEENLICFSSPFDFTAVDFLEELNNPIYKIASFEITDIPLIKYIASRMKPVILFTGIASKSDIELAINTIRSTGNENITLLKCTSSYPAPLNEANLIMLDQFKKDFNVEVGLSDHTEGYIAPIVAVALGAKLIEKHFILDKGIGGPDASFSLDLGEFKNMVDHIREAERTIGVKSYDLTQKQIKGRDFSRSLYVVKNVKAGDIITMKNVKSIRPGFGLHPKYFDKVLGKRFNKNLIKGTRLEMNHIQRN
jgi:pseudaminic acid synthase